MPRKPTKPRRSAKSAKPGRGGPASPAKAIAAKLNGAKGGRPRSKVDPNLLEQLGEPPVGKPLKLARWYTDAIAVLTYQALRGEPVRELLAMVRASSGAAARVLPLDIIYEAGKRLDRDERDMKDPTGGGNTVELKEYEANVTKRASAVRGDPA